MDLTLRQLVFLEHEMTQIIESDDRDYEDKSHASSILGRVEGEIEWEEEQTYNGERDADLPEEIFS